MIYGMISGTLYADPVLRTSAGGKSYCTASVRVPIQGEEAQFVSVAAFDSDVLQALARLKKGDGISVSGPLKPTTWAGRDGAERSGLSIVAQRILDARRPAREPKPRQEQSEEQFTPEAGDLSVIGTTQPATATKAAPGRHLRKAAT